MSSECFVRVIHLPIFSETWCVKRIWMTDAYGCRTCMFSFPNNNLIEIQQLVGISNLRKVTRGSTKCLSQFLLILLSSASTSFIILSSPHRLENTVLSNRSSINKTLHTVFLQSDQQSIYVFFTRISSNLQKYGTFQRKSFRPDGPCGLGNRWCSRQRNN